MYAVVEYYWIKDPTFGYDPILFSLLYPYHFAMAVMFGSVAYSIYSINIHKKRSFESIFLTGSLFLLMLVVEDFAWFTFRAVAPAGDANGGRWILKGEWTTRFMGSIDVSFSEIPNWYFVSIGLAIVSFTVIKGKQKLPAMRAFKLT